MKIVIRSVIPLLICLILLLVFVSHSEQVDCRIYVFAPKCRGISAKRGIDPPGRQQQPNQKLDINADPYAPYEYNPTDYSWDERASDSNYGSRISSDFVAPIFDSSSPPSRFKNSDDRDQGRFLRALVKMYFDQRQDSED
uniref:Uncharacterized protein n=1 Tax=Strigamia maritima TaxID=126957 RepID=T1IZY3_STRMM